MRVVDQIVTEAGRAWWDRLSRNHDGNPWSLDRYGRLAEAGSERLSKLIGADVGRKLSITPHDSLLELGCGAAALTSTLSSQAARTVGADFSFGMVLHARQQKSVRTRYLVAEGSQLPMRDAWFDRVLCYSVFNNFSSVEYASAVVRELIRVAKPGGVILVGQVPDADREKEWFAAYAARFGGSQRSALRARLGGYKRRLAGFLRRGLSIIGSKPAPALHFLYYRPGFFENFATGAGHRIEILPACNLLQSDGDPETYDYRFDVRITVAPR